MMHVIRGSLHALFQPGWNFSRCEISTRVKYIYFFACIFHPGVKLSNLHLPILTKTLHLPALVPKLSLPILTPAIAPNLYLPVQGKILTLLLPQVLVLSLPLPPPPPPHQTFQRRFNVVFRLIRRREVEQPQINVETTLCTSTSKFTTLDNVESTLCISTSIWSTSNNVETMLLFSTSGFTTLGNVETTLWIWPFAKQSK